MSRDFLHKASLLLNVALALAAVAVLKSKTDAPSRPPASLVSGTDPVLAQAARVAAADRDSSGARPSSSRGLRSIIDELRAMGVPNEILARIALTDFEARWDDRFEAVKGDMTKTAALQLEKERGKDSAMTEALGEEGFRVWDRNYMLWEAMSTPVAVNPAEAEAIYALKKSLQRHNLDLEQARLDGTMDEAAINAANDKAYAEHFRRLTQILGDERYAISQQLDEAFTADLLRNRLARANPSDAQFRELYKMERDWNKVRMELDHQFQNDPMSAEYNAKSRALDQKRDQEYQRVLGADVYAALQKTQDPAYSQMKKFETLWGLDDKKIDYVYDTMRTYEESVATYRGEVLARQTQGGNVDWEAVNRDLQNFAETTRTALRTELGETSFEKLQNNRVLRFIQVQRRAR